MTVSDDEPPKPRPKLPVPTLEELGAFVDAHWLSHACERCGTENWAIHESRPFNVLPATDGEVTTYTPNVTTAFAMTCAKCGNIRLTLASHLIGWIAERRNRDG